VVVAVGAVFFMLSDSLLAINKFALPLPMAQFWVLSSYYIAQILIARHALADVASAHAVRVSASAGVGLPQGG
jgi:alkylglycerol monooxygenase